MVDEVLELEETVAIGLDGLPESGVRFSVGGLINRKVRIWFRDIHSVEGRMEMRGRVSFTIYCS